MLNFLIIVLFTQKLKILVLSYSTWMDISVIKFTWSLKTTRSDTGSWYEIQCSLFYYVSAANLYLLTGDDNIMLYHAIVELRE